MFESKEPKESAKKQDGKTFLELAKDEYEELFATFVANADQYASVEQYSEALEAQAWELTEPLIKKSFYNGKKVTGKGSSRK